MCMCRVTAILIEGVEAGCGRGVPRWRRLWLRKAEIKVRERILIKRCLFLYIIKRALLLLYLLPLGFFPFVLAEFTTALNYPSILTLPVLTHPFWKGCFDSPGEAVTVFRPSEGGQHAPSYLDVPGIVTSCREAHWSSASWSLTVSLSFMASGLKTISDTPRSVRCWGFYHTPT